MTKPVIFKSMNYVFLNKNKLSQYLYSALSNPTDLKVQKVLYLAYALYGATFGRLHSNHTIDGTPEAIYPRYLFPANFVAGTYGPVELDLFKSATIDRTKATERIALDYDIPEHRQISLFLNDLIYEFDGIDDFALVMRTCEDEVWRNYYKEDAEVPLPGEHIIDEYINNHI